MEKIISYISDTGLKKKFMHCVRDRQIEQKFLYTAKSGATQYYEILKAKQRKMGNKIYGVEDDYTLLSQVIRKDEEVAIISLGCGNSEREREILKKLHNEGYNFIYIGVDSSKPMLKMAEKTLKDLDIEKQFVASDIANENFKDDISRLTKKYPKKIFAFLGGTLGNVNQTNIADVLYDTLSEGDILWLEVVTRSDANMETDMKMFNRYASYLTNEEIMNFYFHPLAQIGVSRSAGKIILKSFQEKSVGALHFTYSFNIKKKVVVTHKRETIHLLPREEIELQNNRVYHPKTLINFFSEHDFTLIDKCIGEVWGQMMFRK